MQRRDLARILGIHVLLAAGVLAAPARAQHHNGHDERALAEDPRLADGQIAPVLEGLGDWTHPVTTSSDRAQQFFDQGLALTYGFNHQEALRAFKEAARLDPDCAMAYWGWALALGPNINLPMSSEVVPQAWEAMQMALQRAGNVSEAERDYIEALAARYTDDPGADRTPLDAAYVEAMKKLHEKYPDDVDAATLYAAAIMNASPWNYWTRDGRPRESTPTLLAVLEGAMAAEPHHLGANHYYIHAIEPVDPARAETAADNLRGRAPGAGHLVHMPSHIYIQVGRYADAFEANRLAVEADAGYITQCRAQGIYPLNYYPHNMHFKAWAAMMEGRAAEALEAARAVNAAVPPDHHGNDWALYQTFLSMPLFVMTRFGMWDEVLAEPAPPENADYWTGIWRYARALAYASTGDLKRARQEAKALEQVRKNAKDTLIGFTTAGTLLEIASEVVAGEIDAAAGKHADAIAHLDRAVRLEDGLSYTEPPDWYYSVRHDLGAALLEADRPGEAEVVYWQDLRRFPDNGFALYGLAQSLEAQGREEEAAAVRARYEASWRSADRPLTSSRF